MLNLRQTSWHPWTIPLKRPVENENALAVMATDVVRELERAGWDVPEADVTVSRLGSGPQAFHSISSVTTGGDAAIRLLYSAYGLRTVKTADTIVEFDPELEAGDPKFTVSLNLGDPNDPEDVRTFWDAPTYRSPGDDEPRTHLRYVPDRDGRLVPDGAGAADLPDAKPDSMDPKAVLDDVERIVLEGLLKPLRALPEGTATLSDFISEGTTPPPAGMRFYTVVDQNERERIEAAREGDPTLPAHRRTGLSCGGWRLLPLGQSEGGTRAPKLAEDAFAYMLAGDPENPDYPFYMDAHWMAGRRSEIVEVVPDNVDDFYVVDASAAEEARIECLTGHPDPTNARLDDTDVSRIKRAYANTLVPLSEYDGSYRCPVVVANRAFAPGEVRPLPHVRVPRERHRETGEEALREMERRLGATRLA